MLIKFRSCQKYLSDPRVLMALKVLILAATLAAAFFVKTGVVKADPGWGVVGG